MDDPTARSGVAEGPLRSVHTDTFPPLLHQLGVSLVVSTYQAGKVVLVRADGDRLNTHFRIFQKPMGVAAQDTRLLLGTETAIWELRDVPAVAPKAPPFGHHDACYVTRRIHVTGDVDVHEIGIAADGAVWFVNTRFSCLCSLDAESSFVPRWRPNFVRALTPDDRCHLNGLGMRDGRPRYVTALGESDRREAWRETKAHGGIVIDLDTNAIVQRGLSMPHSPRWYAERLWLLESGDGALVTAEPATGARTTVARLPGFTRGLAFAGPVAFVGLSQVRESATFGGLPLTERLEDRS